MQIYCLFMGPRYDLQVINEIEEMLQDSPGMQAEQKPVQSNLIHKSTDHSLEERKCQNPGLIMFIHCIHIIIIST